MKKAEEDQPDEEIRQVDLVDYYFNGLEPEHNTAPGLRKLWTPQLLCFVLFVVDGQQHLSLVV